MELRNVKTFIKVAENGNFSKAAADLGYAQSTVTMQIQLLEKELHTVLFERNGKHVTLSAAGKEFLPMAYQMQRCEDMMLEHFSRDQEPSGKIVIGVMETICASQFGVIFRMFQKKYPKVQIKVVVATTLECMDLLEKGKVDVILTVDRKLNHPNWVTAYEVPTEISFFCASEHPFANREKVPVDQMLQEKFIMIEAGCNYRQAFEQYLEDQGKQISNIMEVGYTRLIIDAVTDNLGISLLPKFTLAEALEKKQIALFGAKEYNRSMLMQVIYSENRWFTPTLRAFVDLTREVFCDEFLHDKKYEVL